MSASAFRQVQNAIQAALQAAPGLSGVSVFANRTRSLPREEQVGVLIRLDRTRQDPVSPLGVRDWTTAFEVEIVARGASGADPAAAIDDPLQAAWLALHGLTAPGLIEVDADPEIDWTFDAGDTPLASALFRLTVQHRTEGNTLNPKD